MVDRDRRHRALLDDIAAHGWRWLPAVGGDPAGWTAEVFGYPGMGGSAPIAGLLFGPTLAVYDWLVFDIGTIVPLTNAQPRAVYLGATFNVGKVF